MGIASGAAKGGASIKRIASALFFLVVLAVWTTYHANFVLGRSLLLAFPGWDVTYKSAWPRLGGGVTASDVTLHAPDDDDATYHFDRVRLDVPFFQYYRSGFSRRRGALLKSIKDVELVFEGGSGDLPLPFSHEMLAFGNATAAPFEAEGCAQDNIWTRDEVAAMGLSPGPTELHMAYHRTDGGLVKNQSLHVPGVGRVDYRREMVMHDDYPLFSLAETGLAEVSADVWQVQDEGFVAKRNAFCAKKDGIDAAQFAERHVASVRRVMEAYGLAPTPGVEAAYRRYASQGGSFNLSLRYEPPIGGELYGNENLATWLPRLHGEFAVGAEKRAFALDSTPVRPLPEDESLASIYAVLQREGRAPEAAESVASADGSAPIVATAAAVTATAAVTSATPTSVAATVPSVPAPTPTPAAAPAPVVAAAPPAPAPTQPTRASPRLAHLGMDHSAPISAEREPPPLEMPGDAPAPSSNLDYVQLAAAVGHRVVVYVKGREPMKAEVAGVDKGVVRIRRHLRSGWVEYSVDKASFDHAERDD